MPTILAIVPGPWDEARMSPERGARRKVRQARRSHLAASAGVPPGVPGTAPISRYAQNHGDAEQDRMDRGDMEPGDWL